MKTDIVEYANRIAKACKKVTAIWLMGSRINGTAREDSDWDFLVFGGIDAFKFLSTHRELHRDDVDCFVQTDDDSFERAWGDRTKSGSLSGWKWKQLTASEAQYTESKWSDREESLGVVLKQRKAVRLWPVI